MELNLFSYSVNGLGNKIKHLNKAWKNWIWPFKIEEMDLISMTAAYIIITGYSNILLALQSINLGIKFENHFSPKMWSETC